MVNNFVVVGSGPAGIVSALKLSQFGLPVTLIDVGGFRFSRKINLIGQFVNKSPKTHAPMEHCQRRQFGGTSNIWGGRIVPFDPIDFENDRFKGFPSWPLKFEDLKVFFNEASNYCKSGDGSFNTRLKKDQFNALVDGMIDGNVKGSDIEKWSLPTNFGAIYRESICNNPKINLLVNHQLLGFEVDCGRVKNVTLFDHEKKTKKVLHCDCLILACGAIEATRHLLLLKERLTFNTIDKGNCLGKYYMGHISGQICNLKFYGDPRKVNIGFFKDKDGVYCRHRLTFSFEFLKRLGLLNIAFWPVNPKIGDPNHGNGILSFSYLILSSPIGRFLAPAAIRAAAIEGGKTRGFFGHIKNIFLDIINVVMFVFTFGYGRYISYRKNPGFFQASKTNEYPLHYHAEQSPCAESQIFLNEHIDEFGLPKVSVRLVSNTSDFHNILRAHNELDKELRANGIGELKYFEGDLIKQIEEQFYDGFHQAGTTRMGNNETDGVTDKYGQVFGLENLYVVSGSVFPTSGQANTTFMIVVFALWVCEHIYRKSQDARA